MKLVPLIKLVDVLGIPSLWDSWDFLLATQQIDR